MANPKSAYSIPTKKGKLDTHIFVVWVDNEAGVLARVVGLFSGRGYNIESLAVAEVDATKNISRITIVTTGTPQVIDQIKLQLKKLVPVHKVADFKREDKKVIFKEMALLKVVGKKKKIEKCIKACKSFNPVIFDCQVDPNENCFPMIPSGKPHNQMILGPNDKEDNKITGKGKALV